MSASDEEAIRRFFDDLLASWKTMDVDSYLSFYTHDALWMPPDRWADADKVVMRHFYLGVFDWAAPDPDDYQLIVHEILVHGDRAIVRWSARGRWLPKDGTPPEPARGRHISVLRRFEERSWRIERDIFNNPPE